MDISHTSAIILPPKQVEEFKWDFKVPARSILKSSYAAPEYRFEGLTFQKGFMSGQKWDVIFHKMFLRLKIYQPTETDWSIHVDSVSIQMISKNEIKGTHPLLKRHSDHSNTVWEVSMINTIKDSWNDEIDTIRAVMRITKSSRGKCLVSLVSEQTRARNATEMPKMLDTSEFFKDSRFADVTIKVKTASFPGHQMILSAHSPVFRQMFSTDMQERLTGQVVVDDIEPNVFELLLKYIYCGARSSDVAELSDDVTLELFQAAHKYGIEPLKILCEIQMTNKVTRENCLEMYSFAEVYEIGMLKETCWRIIQANKKDVFQDRESFKKLTEKFPNVVYDLFQYIP